MPQQHPIDFPAPPAPAPAPAAPLPPAAPGVQAVIAGQTQALTGVPRTAREMSALRRRRTELSNQLTSAAERRGALVRQLERMDPSAQEGVRQRIQLLDQRILQLEADLAHTGQLVVAAPSELIATAGTRSGPSFPVNGARMDYTAIVLAFTFAVLMPIAIAVARLIWRRTTAPVPTRAVSNEDSQRLMRLEQAIDTIAIEVERVSEGQRYVTQLLADNAQQAHLLEGMPAAGRER